MKSASRADIVQIPLISETGEAYETMVISAETAERSSARIAGRRIARERGIPALKDVLLNYPAERERDVRVDSQRETCRYGRASRVDINSGWHDNSSDQQGSDYVQAESLIL